MDLKANKIDVNLTEKYIFNSNNNITAASEFSVMIKWHSFSTLRLLIGNHQFSYISFKIHYHHFCFHSYENTY